MSDVRFDVVGIGNAMVDVLAHVDHAFLDAHGLVKGAMTLVDEARSAALYDAMPAAVEASGGSGANTTAGVASLGGRAAFIGKVKADQMGAVFRHDIRAMGVTFDSTPGDGTATGRCLIFVTSDAQRTMQTWLGAGTELTAQDVDTDVIAAAAITYLEGYLWDSPTAKEAFFRASRIAHDAGRRVSLTLSDPLFVDRHREELLPFVREHVDVLFANQDEAMSLYQVATFDEALQHVRADADIAAITRSAKGSVLVAGDEVHVIDAEPVERVVDTTGAGDLYASGMLYGLARGFDLATCGRIGSIAAAEVISHIGARPEVVLSTLANEKLGSVRELQN